MSHEQNRSSDNPNEQKHTNTMKPIDDSSGKNPSARNSEGKSPSKGGKITVSQSTDDVPNILIGDSSELLDDDSDGETGETTKTHATGKEKEDLTLEKMLSNGEVVLGASRETKELEGHPLGKFLPLAAVYDAMFLKYSEGVNPGLSTDVLLSITGASTSGAVRLDMGGQLISTNTYIAIAAPVASGKSKVVSRYFEGIIEFQNDHCEDPDSFEYTQFKGADTSEAALVKNLELNRQTSIYLLEDESRELLVELPSKSQTYKKLRTLLLKGFQRESYSRARNHSIQNIPEVGLDVCFMAQQDAMYAFAASPEVSNSGLFARFLFAEYRQFPRDFEAAKQMDGSWSAQILKQAIQALCELCRTRKVDVEGFIRVNLPKEGKEAVEEIFRREEERQQGQPDLFRQRTIQQTLKVALNLQILNEAVTAVTEGAGVRIPKDLDLKYIWAAYDYVLARTKDAGLMLLKGSPELFSLISLIVKAGGEIKLNTLAEHGFSSRHVERLIDRRYSAFLMRGEGSSTKKGGRKPKTVKLRPGVAQLFEELFEEAIKKAG